jgi:hypothetical protein
MVGVRSSLKTIFDNAEACRYRISFPVVLAKSEVHCSSRNSLLFGKCFVELERGLLLPFQGDVGEGESVKLSDCYALFVPLVMGGVREVS